MVLVAPAIILLCLFSATSSFAFTNECQNWEVLHPGWIFCDDFESDILLVKKGRYFEHTNKGGTFFPIEGVGIENSRGMRVLWRPGEVDAGNLKLAFGRNSNSYMKNGIRENQDFREIYYRIYLKMQAGWEGSPAKLSRATIIADSEWSQAMIAHLWTGKRPYLTAAPVRCVDMNNKVKCNGYNDFVHMEWIGPKTGITPIFDFAHNNTWFCIEAHVRLNDPGQSNGLQEFWIDGKLEARSEGLNFVQSYSEYGINAVFFENYWNSGSPKQQERYFDNIVVSTQRVGCLGNFTGSSL